MPVTHTNRKGVTYYLHQGTTKKGKTRYFFSKEPTGRTVEQVPDGYEITESVNGIVSLSKTWGRAITAGEVQTVADIVAGYRRLEKYRVAAKRNTIEVYEPSGGVDAEAIARGFQMSAAVVRERLRGLNERYTRYSPVMRFILQDEIKREFSVERWCYRGSVDGWLPVCSEGVRPLQKIARRCIPHLGKDSFYDLI